MKYAEKSGNMTDENFLNIDEAANFLGIRRSTLYKYTCFKRVPHYKPGKKLYFVRSELIDWVKNSPVKTIDEIEQIAINHVTLKS
jgi:excisionase family DNA binding protein